MKDARKANRPPLGGPDSSDRVREAAFERVVSSLRLWVDRVRRIPTALYVVLFVSILSSTGLAYWWFWSRDSLFIQLVSIPWVFLTAVPQFGLWLVASTLQDLFSLPERLWDLKNDVLGQVGQFDSGLGRLEDATKPGKNVFRTLRDAMTIRAELGQLVTTRVVFHRFAGPVAAVLGPLSLVGSSLIIAVGVVQLLAIAL